LNGRTPRLLGLSLKAIEYAAMFDNDAVDAELKQSLGFSMTEVKQVIKAGGDLAEQRFMKCCWLTSKSC